MNLILAIEDRIILFLAPRHFGVVFFVLVASYQGL